MNRESEERRRSVGYTCFHVLAGNVQDTGDLETADRAQFRKEISRIERHSTFTSGGIHIGAAR
jgi:hypothetical protein